MKDDEKDRRLEPNETRDNLGQDVMYNVRTKEPHILKKIERKWTENM